MNARRRTWELALSEATMRTLAFLVALGLTIKDAWETNGPERASRYVLYAGMMGLSILWGAGDRLNGRGGGSKK